jgi:hypothetical protein
VDELECDTYLLTAGSSGKWYHSCRYQPGLLQHERYHLPQVTYSSPCNTGLHVMLPDDTDHDVSATDPR